MTGAIKGSSTSLQTSTLLDSVSRFYPGYFALIMATGIISVACRFLGVSHLDWWLFYLNIAAYVAVWAVTIFRIGRFPRLVWADATNHAKGPGFFTAVAATSILGSQFVILADNRILALLLWTFAIGLWCFLIYTFFTAVTVREPKPDLETGLNGGWLILIVATQSICVLGTLVAPSTTFRDTALFFALCMYLLGCMLYILIISLIVYRWTFFTMSAAQLTPPYWINMGALAITTLAGSRLMLSTEHAPLLHDLLPFIKGFTLFFWVTGTWWIPLLLVLGAWRHVYKKIPLTYDPQYWGMVFPLGMYATATFILGQALPMPVLSNIASVFVYAALFAWALTFAGMLKALARIIVH